MHTLTILFVLVFSFSLLIALRVLISSWPAITKRLSQGTKLSEVNAGGVYLAPTAGETKQIVLILLIGAGTTLLLISPLVMATGGGVSLTGSILVAVGVATLALAWRLRGWRHDPNPRPLFPEPNSADDDA